MRGKPAPHGANPGGVEIRAVEEAATITDIEAVACPAWCIVNHAGDLHGEHCHRSARREVGRDSRDRPIDARLQSTTTDDGNDDGPYLTIGDFGVQDAPRLRVFLGRV